MIQPKERQMAQRKKGRKAVAARCDVVEAHRAALGDSAEAGRVCGQERGNVRPSGVTSFAGCRALHAWVDSVLGFNDSGTG